MKIKLFISLVVLMFSSYTLIHAQNIMEVNSKEVVSLLQKDKKMIVLDVRTPGEFASGHIAGAINIDITQPDAIEYINKLNRNSKYIVYCRTKNRSGVVVNQMLKNDFKTIYQMTDGIVGWNQNELPLEK